MKRYLFNWLPELIDIDIYEDTRVSEMSEKYRKIVGDVGKIQITYNPLTFHKNREKLKKCLNFSN